MLITTLDILRCPYCGGRLDLVTSAFHRADDTAITDGILGCHCCTFPVIDGIPIMHLLESANAAREQLDAGRPDLARRAMFNLKDPALADRVERAILAPDATYQKVVEAFGAGFEGGYFLCRFSDPSFVVAHALIRAVAGTVLQGGGRTLDICGGSGHLTRSMMDLCTEPPVVADLYYTKLWLARRFTAPGCEAVCSDGNGPLPFARGSFRYAMCADAFMYIWWKRQFVQEMLRVTDDRGHTPGAVVISHTHNQLQWSPSLGQPLPQDGYRDLFETITPQVFAETGLFADVVGGGPLDLSRRDTEEVLNADPAFDLVASRHPGVFARHPLQQEEPGSHGEFRLNPMYAVVEDSGDRVRFRLKFPSPDYEEEFGACREYLPEEVVLDRGLLAELSAGRLPADRRELLRRRVVVDLPKDYY